MELLINDNKNNEIIVLKKQKLSKKKKEKNVAQNLSEEKENNHKFDPENNMKIDNQTNDPVEIYKSHYVDLPVNKLNINNDDKTSEPINPNLNFLIQLDSFDKKNKKLQQLVLDKKGSLEKSFEENVANSDLLTIINTESIEKLNESTNYNPLDKSNGDSNAHNECINKDTTPIENKNIIVKDNEQESPNNPQDDKIAEENSQNDEKNEDITKKKKKHRDTKKKNKNHSKEFLSKSVKFYRTVSDLYKYTSPTSQTNISKKNPQPKEENKTEETVKATPTDKHEIEEPHIQINKLESITITKKTENLTITKPVNDPNSHVVNEGIRSPYVQTSHGGNEKLNSPFFNKQMNQPNRYNSPLLNRTNGNINEKVRSPFTNKFSEVSKLAITNSPTPREDHFVANQQQQHSQFYQNNNFFNPLENKNKFTNKYNNLTPHYENTEGMYMVNGIRNPMGNNYIYMNSQFMQPIISPSLAFNFPMNNPQFPSNNVMEVPFMTNFKKYDLLERNFFNKLHNDIIDYSNNINYINESLKEIKIYLIQFVENKLKEFLIKYSIFTVI